MSTDLTTALEKLEEEWLIEPPTGASDLGWRERFVATLYELRDRICPKMRVLSGTLKTEEAILVAVLVDVVGPALSGNGLFVASLYRMIIAYGIDRFCLDPGGALEDVMLE